MFQYLNKRDINPYSPQTLQLLAKGNIDMIQRLTLWRTMDVHNGCVNTVVWNYTGQYLLSGSDDHNLVISDPFYNRELWHIHTAHRSNIFSAKFLPGSNEKIVSCAGDGTIIYTDVDHIAETRECRFCCHRSSVYDVITLPGENSMFLSCGEDGTVRCFDLRVAESCPVERCRANILLDLGRAVTAIAVNPKKPYEMAVGCQDSMIRVYDRRMLNDTDPNEGTWPAVVMRMRPKELRGRQQRITCLRYDECFGPSHHHILASYSSAHLYLFDTQTCHAERLSPHKEGVNDTGSGGADGDEGASSSLMKRLRLRGDWSDTGPQARPERRAGTSVQGTMQPSPASLGQARPTLQFALMQRMSSMLTRMLQRSPPPSTQPQPPRPSPPVGGEPPQPHEPSPPRPLQFHLSESQVTQAQSFERELQSQTMRQEEDSTGNFVETPAVSDLNHPAESDSLQPESNVEPQPECSGQSKPLETQVPLNLKDQLRQSKAEDVSAQSMQETVLLSEVIAGFKASDVDHMDVLSSRQEELQVMSESVDPLANSEVREEFVSGTSSFSCTNQDTQKSSAHVEYSVDGYTPLDSVPIANNEPTSGSSLLVDLNRSDSTTNNRDGSLTRGSHSSHVTYSEESSARGSSDGDGGSSGATAIGSFFSLRQDFVDRHHMEPSVSLSYSDAGTSSSIIALHRPCDAPPTLRDSNEGQRPRQSLLPTNRSSGARIHTGSKGSSSSCSSRSRSGSRVRPDASSTGFGDSNMMEGACGDELGAVGLTVGSKSETSIDCSSQINLTETDRPLKFSAESINTTMEAQTTKTRPNRDTLSDNSDTPSNDPTSSQLYHEDATLLSDVSKPVPESFDRQSMHPDSESAVLSHCAPASDRYNDSTSSVGTSVVATAATHAPATGGSAEERDDLVPASTTGNDLELLRGTTSGLSVAGQTAISSTAISTPVHDAADSSDDESDQQPKTSTGGRVAQALQRHVKRLREEAALRLDGPPQSSVPYATHVNTYVGHRNSRTMIKEACFWGADHVMSGSDCGRVFIWNRHSQRLVMLLEADRRVVNCLQPHPTLPMLASSGIDYNVKLWCPLMEEPSFDDSRAAEIMECNEVLLEETRDTVTVPATFMIRILASLNNMRSSNPQPGDGAGPSREEAVPSRERVESADGQEDDSDDEL